MKKIMAKLLAFCLIVNVLTFGVIHEKVVHASALNYVYNYDTKNISSDLLLPNTITDDQTFLEWNTSDPSTGSLTDTSTLKYHLTNGQEVVLTIKKNDVNRITATYELLNYDASTGAVDHYSDVYSILKVYNGSNFIPAINYPHSAIDYTNVILKTDMATDGVTPLYTNTNNGAMFQIERGREMVFQVNNEIVRLKWDNNTGKFFYLTNGAKKDGKFYDFTLKVVDAANQILQPSTTYYILKGFGSNAIISSPTADYGVSIDEITNPMQKPAVNPGIDIKLTLPYIWENGGFTQTPSVTPIKAKDIALEIGDVSKNGLAVAIPDIYATTLTGTCTNNTNVTVTVSNVTTSDGTKQIDIQMNNTTSTGKLAIAPSTIYSKASIIYGLNCTDPNWYPQRTELGAGVVYTYLKYEIIAKGTNKYTMLVYPYQYDNQTTTEKGSYTLYSVSDQTGSTPTPIVNGSLNPQFKAVTTESYNAGDPPILIELNLDVTKPLPKWFIITAKLTGIGNNVPFYSQSLKYVTNKNDVIYGIPNNVTVPVSKIVEDKDGNKYLQMQVNWEVGYSQDLKNFVNTSYGIDGKPITMNYTFRKKANNADVFTNQSIFGKVNLKFTTDGTNISTMVLPDTANMPSGVTFVSGSYNDKARTEMDSNGNPIYVASAVAIFNISLIAPKNPTPSDFVPANPIFLYPYTYFIDAYSQYNLPVIDSNNVITYVQKPETPIASVPVNIVINDVEKIEEPTVQQFQVNDEQLQSITTSWQTVTEDQISDYVKYMLYPKDLTVDSSTIKFNMYISTNKNNLTVADSQHRDDTISMIPSTNTRTFTVTGANTSVDLSNVTDDSTTRGIDQLRNGAVVKITNIAQDITKDHQTFLLNNLDKNQSYYIIIEALYIPSVLSDGSVPDPTITKYSKPSSLVSGTTANDIINPDINDYAQPAPTDLKVESITRNTGKISWKGITLPAVQADKYQTEYQILRIEGGELRKLSENYELTTESFGNLFSDLSKNEPTTKSWEMVGSQTQGANVLSYNKQTDSVSPADASIFATSINGGRVNFTDNQLSPNKLYFYYVRTIVVAKNSDGTLSTAPQSYSQWAPISLTSEPVKAPINLKVEKNFSMNNVVVSMNKQQEAIISFDAQATANELTPTKFSLFYEVKQDNQDWKTPVMMSSFVVTPVTMENGLTHYVYKITGLTQGTSYTVKVRLVDNNPKGGDVSLWSNEVRIYTDIDPVEYDINTKTDKWMENYKSQLAEMMKSPYWNLTKSTSQSANFSAVYRTSMANGVLKQTYDSTVYLGKAVGQMQTYYIPAGMLIKSNFAQKGFTITLGNQVVTLSPNALDPDTNTAIINALANNTLNDYFIKITVSLATDIKKINNDDALSPQMTVSASVVGFSTTEQKWEDTILDQLDTMTTDRTMLDTVQKQINVKIRNGATNQELVQFITTKVIAIQDNFANTVNSSFTNNLRNSYSINTFKKPMMIKAKVAPKSVVHGFQKNGSQWNTIATTPYGDKIGISTTTPGVFIFGGHNIIIYGLSNIKNASVITSLIARYELDDVLGTNGVIDVNKNASQNMVATVVARIAGASNKTSPMPWLGAKGYSLRSQRPQMGIQTQEAVYYMMSLYELKANVKISGMKISNQKATQKFMKMDTKYVPSIKAAVQTTVWSDSTMNAAQGISIKNVLSMLGALSTKVKL